MYIKQQQGCLFFHSCSNKVLFHKLPFTNSGKCLLIQANPVSVAFDELETMAVCYRMRSYLDLFLISDGTAQHHRKYHT